MKILLTTVCNDDYALGGQVMLYSMKKNLNDFDKCDIKIYYNDIIAPLSDDNKEKFKAIGDNIILEYVDESKYLDAKVPYHQGRSAGSHAAYLTLESFGEYDYDKVIMFDVDMLCIGDFSELFTSHYHLGIFNRNTGFVVLGKEIRNSNIYNGLISHIKHHNGDFMDQGIVNKALGHLFQPLPAIYNQYKPIFKFDENTKIIHWAHFDYIKPWALDYWKDKVELFEDLPPYPHPDSKTGNVPTLPCKPAYDLWVEYKNEMYNKLKF